MSRRTQEKNINLLFYFFYYFFFLSTVSWTSMFTIVFTLDVLYKKKIIYDLYTLGYNGTGKIGKNLDYKTKKLSIWVGVLPLIRSIFSSGGSDAGSTVQ